VFGQEPPVYAKPKQQPSNAIASSSSSRGPAHLRDRRPPPPPQVQGQVSDGPPQRPAKPGSSYPAYDTNQHIIQPLQSPQNYSQLHTTHSHATPAGSWSLSPRPVPGSPTNLRDASPNGRGSENRPAGRQASWQQMNDTASPNWTRQSLDQPQRSVSLQFDGAHSISPSLSQPPLPPLQRATFEVSPAPPAANIPAPVRPPNPELLQMHAALHQKIQARLQHLRSTVGDSHHQLRLLIGDLDRGEPAIRDEMARLEAVRDVCKATGDGLEGAVIGGRNRVEELRGRSEPDVDGMICATSIVGNQ
jgi:ESCRT-I complex subunit TSG101